MQDGYIYLERKLLSKGFWKNSYYTHLWIHLIFLASHEDKEFIWLGETQKLRRGQFITGRKKLAEDTGISETTVERILDYFEREGQIGQQKTNKFRLITVLNYDKYQSKKTTNGQQTDNTRTHSSNSSNESNTLSKDKEATPRLPKGIILLKGEPTTMSERIDHSFPRSRLYGDEKINWLLDYAEHLLNRKLGGQERWNRIYARHSATRYGMGRCRAVLDFALSPDSWWFDKVSQFSTIYKNFEKLEQQSKAPKTNESIKKAYIDGDRAYKNDRGDWMIIPRGGGEHLTYVGPLDAIKYE